MYLSIRHLSFWVWRRISKTHFEFGQLKLSTLYMASTCVEMGQRATTLD